MVPCMSVCVCRCYSCDALAMCGCAAAKRRKEGKQTSKKKKKNGKKGLKDGSEAVILTLLQHMVCFFACDWSVGSQLVGLLALVLSGVLKISFLGGLSSGRYWVLFSDSALSELLRRRDGEQGRRCIEK